MSWEQIAIKAAPQAVNSFSGLLDSWLNRSYNERQTALQWQRAREQWERENEWNLPVNEVARLRDAGINPALAYMNGASFAPAASSPEPGVNKSQGFGLQTQLDPMMVSQIRLNEAQARDLEASAKTKEEKLPEEVKSLKHQNELYLKQVEDFRHKWEAMDVENQYKTALRLNIKFDQVMRGKEYMLLKKRLEQEIEESKSRIKLTDEQVREIRYNVNYLIKTEALRIMGLSLQNSKMRAEVGLTRNEMNNAYKTGQLLGYQVNTGWTKDMYEQMRIKEVKDFMEQRGTSDLPFVYTLEEMLLYSIGRATGVVK